ADADNGVLLGVVERGAEADPCFRARIARRERGPETIARLSRQAGSDRSASDYEETHAVEVVGVEVGLSEHQRQLGRDTGEGRHPMFDGEPERVRGAPAPHDEA